MARARSPNRVKAEEIYLKNKGNIELVKIAEILNRPPGTVRGWKNKDKWDDKLNGTFQGKGKNNTERSKHNKNKIKDSEIKAVEKLEEADLTEKQRLFCLYYIKSFNATMAAIKAGYSKDSAHVIGHENLRKPNIKKEIKRLKGNMTEDIFIDAMDVLNKYIEIAFADITDYVSFGNTEIIVDKDEEGKPITRNINYVDLKGSDYIDGTILTEVSQGKDGVKVKLADKMKALEKLELYFDLLPDKFKRQIQEEKLQIEKEGQKARIEKLKAEIGKIEDKEDKNIRVTIVDDIEGEKDES